MIVVSVVARRLRLAENVGKPGRRGSCSQRRRRHDEGRDKKKWHEKKKNKDYWKLISVSSLVVWSRSDNIIIISRISAVYEYIRITVWCGYNIIRTYKNPRDAIYIRHECRIFRDSYESLILFLLFFFLVVIRCLRNFVATTYNLYRYILRITHFKYTLTKQM